VDEDTVWDDFNNIPLIPVDFFVSDFDGGFLNRCGGRSRGTIWRPETCTPAGSDDCTEDDDCPEEQFCIDDICNTCEVVDVGPIIPVPTEPSTVNEGNFASVLGDNCDYLHDCNVCVRGESEDLNDPLIKIELDFIYTPVGSGCSKTFTAVHPDCVEDPQYFWSFGKTGSPVSYTIENIPGEGGTGCRETITLTMVDARGCIYHKTKVVTSECPCPGVSGTLNVTEIGECLFRLEAEITGPSDEVCVDGAFIEIQFPAKCDPDTDCTPCDVTEVEFQDCMVEDSDGPDILCSTGLADGTHYDHTVCGFEVIRWRLWDNYCGCPGPWNEVELDCSECACCNGQLSGLIFTVLGAGDGDSEFTGYSCNCEAMNTIFNVPAITPCAGNTSFEDFIQCDPLEEPNEPFTLRVTGQYLMFCDEDDFWLSADFALDQSSGASCGTTASAEIYLGNEKPMCGGLTGELFTSGDEDFCFCLGPIQVTFETYDNCN